MLQCCSLANFQGRICSFGSTDAMQRKPLNCLKNVFLIHRVKCNWDENNVMSASQRLNFK